MPIKLYSRRRDLERNKDKIDHYQTGSDTRLITRSGTTPGEDIGEEQNLKSIDQHI